MPAKGPKQPLIITPRAHAAYAWLNKPDTKYKDEGEFKLTIVLDKNDLGEGRLDNGKKPVSGDDFLKYILDLCEEYGVEADPKENGCPIKDGDGYRNGKGKLVKKEEFEGKWLISAKTRYQPDLMDTKGRDLPDNVVIFSGDLVKAALKPNIGEGDDGPYMSMYLNKVMLVEKLAKRSNGAGMFGDEEGFVADDDHEDSVDFGEEDDNNGDF